MSPSYSFTGVTRRQTPMEVLGVVFTALVFVGSCGYVCMGWYEGSYDIHLQHARTAMYDMMDEDRLTAAGFFDQYPEGKPSDFVSFIDPDDGNEDYWPPTRSEGHDSSPIAKLENQPSTALRPDEVRFVAFEPDPDDQSRQLVYIPRDDERTIDLHGYVDPTAEPLYTWSVDFPTSADED